MTRNQIPTPESDSVTQSTPTHDEVLSPPGPGQGTDPAGLLAGFTLVALLAWASYYLAQNIPAWAQGTGWSGVAKTLEYPVYAIGLGLLANAVISLLGVRGRLARAFKTEVFIKTGLVLLGATINLGIIGRAAAPAIAQAVLLITLVFGFTWWLGGILRVNDKLRALLSSAVSICGVSAAIAAAGAVQAKKEQLAYAAGIVIMFALPSIFLLPWFAEILDLSPAVAGAWIGGNIDTTAAVTAAGALAGEESLQIAAIVKTTQNALIGIVAVLLMLYFAIKVDRRSATRPGLGELWHRFPKFVLGFVAASVIATAFLEFGSADAAAEVIRVIKIISKVFFILAFVSIGLEFKVATVKEAGWKPIIMFGSATVFNLVAGLALASWLFASFTF